MVCLGGNSGTWFPVIARIRYNQIDKAGIIEKNLEIKKKKNFRQKPWI